MSVSLNKIVDVNVDVSVVSPITSDFNLAMIIGSSLEETENTVKIYDADSYQTEMVNDGYETTSNEYKAATLYFSQTPNSNRLAIGQMITGDSAQTPAQAFTALRAMNEAFYGVCFADTLTSEQIQAVAALVEASGTPTVFFYSSSDANALVASTTNVFSSMKALGYDRSFGFYNESTGIDAAVLGLISGLNSMDAASAYTAAYKTLAGITPSNISDAQLDILTGYAGNAYVEFAKSYNFTYPCISAGGYHIDDLYLVDAAKYLIQQNVVAGLVAQRKIPQSESGLAMILNFVSGACATLQSIGMIAGGIWNGQDVADLKAGDAIQNGYYIAADSMASQSAADRAARRTPNIYVALLSAGAIEHVVIRVFVSR